MKRPAAAALAEGSAEAETTAAPAAADGDDGEGTVFSLRFHDFLTSGGCIFWIYSPKVVYLISCPTRPSKDQAPEPVMARQEPQLVHQAEWWETVVHCPSVFGCSSHGKHLPWVT